MTEPHRPDEPATPGPPRLGPAADHRAAAEHAAERRDFDTALRERFRAVLRGLEQNGMLEVRRSRTAQETADDATTVLPLEEVTELHPAAQSFDEVIYGGRRATEDEYRRLEYADRYSPSAPPPPPEPTEKDIVERAPRERELPTVPQLLRNPKFWAALAAIAAVALLLWGLSNALNFNPPDKPHNPSAPTQTYSPTTTRTPPPTTTPPKDEPLEFGEGSGSVFSRHPVLAYTGVQVAIAGAVLIWWRARRRGALVGEPRPVEVAANELLHGQAALYQRAKDPAHVADKLRAATLRRIRPVLGVYANAEPHQLVEAVVARTGADPELVAAALYGPVPDRDTLALVAAQLHWIDTEVGS